MTETEAGRYVVTYSARIKVTLGATGAEDAKVRALTVLKRRLDDRGLAAGDFEVTDVVAVEDDKPTSVLLEALLVRAGLVTSSEHDPCVFNDLVKKWELGQDLPIAHGLVFSLDNLKDMSRFAIRTARPWAKRPEDLERETWGCYGENALWKIFRELMENIEDDEDFGLRELERNAAAFAIVAMAIGLQGEIVRFVCGPGGTLGRLRAFRGRYDRRIFELACEIGPVPLKGVEGARRSEELLLRVRDAFELLKSKGASS